MLIYDTVVMSCYDLHIEKLDLSKPLEFTIYPIDEILEYFNYTEKRNSIDKHNISGYMPDREPRFQKFVADTQNGSIIVLNRLSQAFYNYAVVNNDNYTVTLLSASSLYLICQLDGGLKRRNTVPLMGDREYSVEGDLAYLVEHLEDKEEQISKELSLFGGTLENTALKPIINNVGQLVGIYEPKGLIKGYSKDPHLEFLQGVSPCNIDQAEPVYWGAVLYNKEPWSPCILLDIPEIIPKYKCVDDSGDYAYNFSRIEPSEFLKHFDFWLPHLLSTGTQTSKPYNKCGPRLTVPQLKTLIEASKCGLCLTVTQLKILTEAYKKRKYISLFGSLQLQDWNFIAIIDSLMKAEDILSQGTLKTDIPRLRELGVEI